MASARKTGKLYLIGAGPGDPELLTLKAVRCLALCDVVLYDRLVSPKIVAMSRTGAELINVGKHQGEQEHTQSRIMELIRTHTLGGKTVARLKGGDPLVFGRGAEEWEFALRLGIEVELIPGVSSTIAVPGLAGIPLTFRKVSQSFVVVTGHCRDGLAREWERYAQVDTLVILMGVQNRVFIAQSLIAAGRSGTEPVAFIQRGTLPGEAVVESTLAEVAAGTVEIHSPAVFVVGDVVKLRAGLTPTAATQQAPAPAME
ncbi:MAG TPA: uroporphyrinogen-III C-methyltransferase [Bryobacteraceae bacterium]|nr:uroporphyrinogen-III C-methyltransferase [Bryobacteraceae bacterium]